MGISITRDLSLFEDIGGELLIIKKTGHSIAKFEVLEFFGRIPRGVDYRVTYTLDDSGPYLVYQGYRMICLTRVKKSNDKENNMSACWLPKTWVGRKVRRNIKITMIK